MELGDKAAALVALHAGPGFVIPNAWDAGSARILEDIGFPALATTSAGIAWSLGIPDGGRLDRATALEHIGRIASAVEVPVSADLEAGYGDTPDEVGETVGLALASGAVGANIEDARDGTLIDLARAVDRIAAARDAASGARSFSMRAPTPTSPEPPMTRSRRRSTVRSVTSTPAPIASSCPAWLRPMTSGG